MKTLAGALTVAVLALWPGAEQQRASTPFQLATYSPPPPKGASEQWCTDRGRRFPPGQLRTVCNRRDLKRQCVKFQCMACLPEGRWRYDEGRC